MNKVEILCEQEYVARADFVVERAQRRIVCKKLLK